MTRVFVVALLLALSRGAGAQAVFSGDPIDPTTGAPYMMLPGVPLVHPGEDGRFGEGHDDDDFIDTGLVGDVDLVMRTGGGWAGGPIPTPHAGLANAPVAVTGGTATGAGNRIAFQAIVSDGLPPAVTGNALGASDLNGRPVLAIAFGDLDGDGVIGPTAADGTADDAVERQEIVTPVGRQAAPIAGGVANGSLALTVGAPASIGGLGVVVGGGATTGDTPFLYFDGPWIATLLPYMPPVDPDRIIGSNGVGGPDPAALLTDFELEPEDVFSPAPNHPVLGTPYAIPVDGSSVTVDLVRSESGAAVGVACGRAVDPATFVPGPARRLLPAVGPTGVRTLVEPLDAVALASDGAGGAQSIDCFVVDRLGNATDPPPSGFTVTFEAGARTRIVSPDTDGDPMREPVAFGTAAAVTLVVDDAGAAAATPMVDRVVASRGGVPVGALRVDLAAGPGGPGGPGPGTPGALGETAVKMRLKPSAVRGRLSATTKFDPGASFDPIASGLRLEVGLGEATVYVRTIAPGQMTTKGRRTTFRYRDPSAYGSGRIARLLVRRDGGTMQLVRLRVRVLDLESAAMTSPSAVLRIEAGSAAFVGELACSANRSATVTTCRR
jgi:hypothetical protein